MHKLSLFLFLAVFLVIYVGMHYYVFIHIANGLLLSSAARTLLLLIFILGALSFFVIEMLSRRTDALWLKPFSTFGMIWLGALAMALAVFFLADIAGLIFRGPLSRYYLTLGALGALGISVAYSLFNVYVQGPMVKELRLAMPKLPQELSGFTIVQISDIHVNSFSSPRWFDGIVEKTNALHPDLVVITGDLIDSDLCRFDHFCDALRTLKARYGIYAITGNHEYYTGIDTFMRIARETNIKVLRNENATVAGAVQLVGIDDVISAKAGRAKNDIQSAMNSPAPLDPEKPVILLAHRPDTFDAARELGIDLQLSGHTHAGQIPPMDLIVWLAFKYPVGFYHKGNAWCYTTTGTGYWGPPMRLTSRSEIVKIVLERP